MKLSSKVQALTDLITPAIAVCDVELWGLEFKPQGKHSLLRIYIDLPESRKSPENSEKDNSVSVEECKRVSHQVSGLLDVHDPIAGEYVLEVSSPGWDRQFFKPEQMQNYINETIAVRLINSVANRRKFNGRLLSVSESVISVETSSNKKGQKLEIIEVMINNIDKVNLVYDI